MEEKTFLQVLGDKLIFGSPPPVVFRVPNEESYIINNCNDINLIEIMIWQTILKKQLII